MRVIAGSGRSGTTWVLDCLADANALRPVFEPLHPARSEIGARYAYKLIEPGESHPELQHYFEEIQSSHHWSTWTTYRSSLERLFPRRAKLFSLEELRRARYHWRQLLKNFWTLQRAARRDEPLIKCIRANLALGWLVKSLGARVVMIVRHPCAVVESQHRLGTNGRAWNPSPVLDRFRADRRFNECTQGAYLELMNQKLTTLEALTLLWVMENKWAVDRAADYGYSLVSYEELLAEPETQWLRICKALSLAHVPTLINLQRPSQQSSRDLLAHGTTPDTTWVRRFGTDQLAQIQRVLDETHFDLYRVGSTHPDMPLAHSVSEARHDL